MAWYSRATDTVDDVLFVNRYDGYLFGQRTLLSRDGGRHWQRVGLPPVVQMAAGEGAVYALAKGRRPPITLWSSAPGSASWRPVALPPGAKPAQIAVTGRTVALLQAGVHLAAPGPPGPGRLWVSAADGAAWKDRRVPCRTVRDGGAQLISIARGHPDAFLLDCYNNRQSSQELVTSHHLYGSATAGRTWVRLGDPAHNGAPALLADNGSGHAVLTTESGGYDALRVTSDGGRTWSRALVDGGDWFGWADLKFVTADVGYVVGPTHYAPEHLYRTIDGGRTWRIVRLTVNSSTAAYALPRVGAPSYPRRIYPPARRGGGGGIPACPSPSGVEPLTPNDRAVALKIWITMETGSFDEDLHHTDRAITSTRSRSGLGEPVEDSLVDLRRLLEMQEVARPGDDVEP